jgi:hypothetical protein
LADNSVGRRNAQEAKGITSFGRKSIGQMSFGQKSNGQMAFGLKSIGQMSFSQHAMVMSGSLNCQNRKRFCQLMRAKLDEDM